MARVIGVDPGAKGYLCLLNTNPLLIIQFYPTPNEKVTAKDVFNWIYEIHQAMPIDRICVENVHSIHGASAGSNFKFGYNVGMIRGIVEASGIGVDLVQPKAWQKAVGVPQKPANLKKAIAEVATRLYPNVSLYGPRGGLIDGKADALMIAHYLTIKYGGK